eukprot:CAMPEP_0119340440 /NCGR_PEP_ID=MMETSP1333-20130426/100386_1 /TAXON_ID=418940 /ORGANISM="Scyphosphaera apsteinii, Strain RCC1455" /LENGTH=215 /DNA_ID=CAMNT_0007352195 /DNA_START=67 /DNA_END=714 /DNA_ORIENTATION=-
MLLHEDAMVVGGQEVLLRIRLSDGAALVQHDVHSKATVLALANDRLFVCVDDGDNPDTGDDSFFLYAFNVHTFEAHWHRELGQEVVSAAICGDELYAAVPNISTGLLVFNHDLDYLRPVHFSGLPCFGWPRFIAIHRERLYMIEFDAGGDPDEPEWLIGRRLLVLTLDGVTQQSLYLQLDVDSCDSVTSMHLHEDELWLTNASERQISVFKILSP